MKTRRAGVLLFLLLLPGAVAAQDEKEQEGEAFASPLVGAAWCAVKPIDERENPKEDELGCDGGFGAALLRRGRAALVGVLGSKSLGLGAAWVLNPGARTPIAVAAGVVVPWDGNGIYTQPALSVGGTISWKGGE